MRRFAVSLLLSLLGLSVQAAEPQLRVVLFDVVPYAAQVDGKLQGLYVDWVRDFLGSLGLQATIELVPFARIPLVLEQREADLTLSFATEALERVALPLGPVRRVESLVVTSAARPASQLSDLKGELIGRARGGCQDLAQRADLQLRWADVSGFDKGLRMLELGRLDGLCLTRDVLRHYLPLIGMERQRFGPDIVVSTRTVSLFARKTLDAAALERLRSGLAQRPAMRRD